MRMPRVHVPLPRNPSERQLDLAPFGAVAGVNPPLTRGSRGRSKYATDHRDLGKWISPDLRSRLASIAQPPTSRPLPTTRAPNAPGWEGRGAGCR